MTKIVLLIPIDLSTGRPSQKDVDELIEEARGLCAAIDLDVMDCKIAKVSSQLPSTLFGKGKVLEFQGIISERAADLVVINTALSPIQQRNLEKTWGVKVLDRVGLILEIFGVRAQTKEGRLQVELASLTFQKSRLVRSWTHLERQRGGAGFMGGPGETQIELDRRILKDRITQIKKSLEKIKNTRLLHRKQRQKKPYPLIAIVGYTNAGKSTLFNQITNASVFAKDLLFATLDPTIRKVTLPSGKEVVVSDTVGFISNLPTFLVAAFRATLEEVCVADYILHVKDLSNPNIEAQSNSVLEILEELEIDTLNSEKILNVYNKMDLIPKANAMDCPPKKLDPGVFVSAKEGAGISDLLEKIDSFFSKSDKIFEVRLCAEDGKSLSWLYKNARILGRQDKENYIFLRVGLDEILENRFNKECTDYSCQIRLLRTEA